MKRVQSGDNVETLKEIVSESESEFSVVGGIVLRSTTDANVNKEKNYNRASSWGTSNSYPY